MFSLAVGCCSDGKRKRIESDGVQNEQRQQSLSDVIHMCTNSMCAAVSKFEE